ncbi:hypothetical protein MMC29_007080 [Sticta canariensis]|nr:hypothetical protein [Sticta canariensis]
MTSVGFPATGVVTTQPILVTAAVPLVTIISSTPTTLIPIALVSISNYTPITSTPITLTLITLTPTTLTPITSTSITSTPITSTPITSTSITLTPITSTPTTTTSTVPHVRKLSKGARSGIGVGVIGFLFLVVIAIVWYRQFHRKKAGHDSTTSEGHEASFSKLEIAERSHELDGEEILELGGSMLHSPAEVDGTEAATASSQTEVQTSTIATKSDQESQLLPEAIHESRGNSVGRKASPGKETQIQAKMNELNRLEEEERRIDEMIADAERLERLRKERLAIQDRIKQAKAESTARE